MSDDNNIRKPHNHYDELTPAQREEWDKRMQMEEEESAKISAAKAEVDRIKEIGDAQKTFGKIERAKLTIDNGNGKEKNKDKKKKHFVLKHSEKGLLTEVVIIGRKPYFALSRIKDNSKEVQITLEESIENEIERIFPLPNPMSRIFDFKSEGDFYSYVRKAKNETLDSLYKKVKSIWKKYIDSDDFHISLCAADTVFTYFQDKIGLTHYLFFVGGGDTGKSNNLTVIEYVGYRCFNSLGITSANIYTFLGNGEEGQGTICEDEADNIDYDHEKMKYYKSGYQSGKKVARTDLPQGERTQNKWNTFCFKAFASERLPDIVKAKGFHQRIIVLHCEDGFPKYDIAEVMGEDRDEEYQMLFDELNDTQNLLLAYRLLHFHDVIPNIKLNIRNREKQLFKPILRVFQNTKTIEELLPVVSGYINQRREKNANSLEAYVYHMVDELIKARNSYALESSAIWTKLKDSLSGQDIPRKPLSYDTALFGVISQKKITGILEEQFGAKRLAHKGSGNTLILSQDRLKALDRKYNPVNVKVVANEHEVGDVGDVGEDRGGVGLDKHVNEESKLSESGHKNDNISINDGHNDGKTITGNGKKGLTRSYKHPQTSPSSPNPEEKAAKLKEYERLSALSRKKSKDAAKG